MKLSIIMPVYNAQEYLQRCLDSIMEQSLDDYELILVNDGSKDSSQSIIDQYKSRYPQLINSVTVENGGQGRARNIGIELAKGEYLGFVDSDDWIAPDMFSKMLAEADRQNADLVVCDIMSCYDDGREIPEQAFKDKRPLFSAGAVWNKLFRRDAVAQLRFPQGLWYEDLFFSAKYISCAKKIVHVPEALYYYRRGHVSTMNNDNSVKNLDMLEVMSSLEDCITRNCGRDNFEYLLINHVLLDSINRLAAQRGAEKKPVIQLLRDYVREKVPGLLSCSSFREESLNRRIIMHLNYMGLENVSKFILRVKKHVN